MTDSSAHAQALASSEAVVESVGFDVAHDSDGLLILTLRFPNGAASDLQLEGGSIGEILSHLGLAQAQDLVGQRFSALAPALPVNTRR